MLWRSLCNVQFLILIAIYSHLSLVPKPQDVLPFTTNDLIMHFAGYFVAAFSISFARPNWHWGYRAGVIISFSILIEIFQHFSPPRTFSIADIVANTMGVFLGIGIITLLSNHIPLCERLLNWKFGRKD
jgi:VanZ family protein